MISSYVCVACIEAVWVFENDDAYEDLNTSEEEQEMIYCAFHLEVLVDVVCFEFSNESMWFLLSVSARLCPPSFPR